MAARFDHAADLLQIRFHVEGGNVGPGRHDLDGGGVVEFDDRFDHLPFLLVHHPLLLALLDGRENVLLDLLLDLFRLTIARSAGGVADEMVGQVQHGCQRLEDQPQQMQRAD